MKLLLDVLATIGIWLGFGLVYLAADRLISRLWSRRKRR